VQAPETYPYLETSEEIEEITSAFKAVSIGPPLSK
jgi:hypothetical protein